MLIYNGNYESNFMLFLVLSIYFYIFYVHAIYNEAFTSVYSVLLLNYNQYMRQAS